ncbi:transcriptional regulator [Planomonospora parontospora subsp. parontospora]|uniref:Transcriptional regulator n=2 Tax=Planomonospora parontospora TaxID=58119 RepID=A0AA37F6F2_9ACTN|nr:helix-turn-helix transcriptional regulator [Planomonospora parontospora]GGK84050.1 transcriptional regulator [Planomonospora parontospora]GII10530.1 transcriptional regulator [Planomonospora parontospora subsp. parontospora]
MDTKSELGDFLKNRRARLSPEELGLKAYGTRRRVSGLRREELAMLAGVSVTHYTRLEQGRAAGASDSVLDALARALRLTEDETVHLKRLARPPASARPASPRPEHATRSARRLLDAMTEVPALVLDRRNDILAWNRLGHALLAGHLDPAAPGGPAARPNLTRMLFLDEHFRELYPDWSEEATLAVASLRLAAGRHPDDRSLAELVGGLVIRSEEFAARWARHPVRTCTSGVKHFHHPVVGPMELHFENLLIPGDLGQRIIAYSAEPGSPSESALRLLSLSAPGFEPVREPDASPGRGRSEAGAAGAPPTRLPS